MSYPYLTKYLEKIYDIYNDIEIPLVKYYRNPIKYPLKDELHQLMEFKSLQGDLTLQAKEIAELLQHPELFDELDNFNKLLKEHYNFNLILKDIFARNIVKKIYPEFEEFENQLKKRLVNREISFYQVNKLMKDKIELFLTTQQPSLT